MDQRQSKAVNAGVSTRARNTIRRATSTTGGTHERTMIATQELVVPRSIPITSPASAEDDCHRRAKKGDE